MALLPFIVAVVYWATASSANDVQEDALCPLIAIVPQQQKLLAEKLCKLEESMIIVIEHILQGQTNRADMSLMGSTEATDEDQSIEKRKNEFIRFGKRKNEFIRFGKRKNEFIRFGKRKNEFIRFGRSEGQPTEDFDELADDCCWNSQNWQIENFNTACEFHMKNGRDVKWVVRSQKLIK